MASQSIDDALMRVKAQVELAKTRQEVQKAEQQASKPIAYSGFRGI